ARALDGGRASTLSSVATLVVQPAPPAPHDLVAELKGEAVSLRWAGTVPSPAPTPPPSPAPSPAAPAAATGSPAPARPPSPSPTPRPPSRGFLVYRRPEPGGHYGDPLRAEPMAATNLVDT